jgi:hypothetical protein
MTNTSLNLNTNIKLENQRQEPKMCITKIHSLWVKSEQWQINFIYVNECHPFNERYLLCIKTNVHRWNSFVMMLAFVTLSPFYNHFT